MKTIIPTPSKFILAWLPFVVFVTIISGAIYGTAQQVLRQTANDVPAQLVNQALFNISQDHSESKALPTAKVSLAMPFVTIYDTSGKQIATNLDPRISLSAPPKGVFDNAKARGENRITWQPSSSLRLATVMKYYNDSSLGYIYVMGAENLDQTEKHESEIGKLVLLGWAAALFGTYLTVWADTKSKRK